MLQALIAEPEECAVKGRKIEDGDLVVVYETHGQMKAVRVQMGKTLQNRFGSFPHSEWVGKPFGCKVFASRRGGSSSGFVFLLAPTPELWTQVLPHRTQILYMPDIAVIVSRLNLTPGCTVLESGTGSGSLTHSLARAVAPSGKVRTFEYHDVRAQAAREDFDRNGLGQLVELQVRDIQGLGFPPELQDQADAVFLDLPNPWLAVPSAANCLKPNGMFCSFSPCIEQVQRCSEALRQHSFTDLQTFEVLNRTYDLHQCPEEHSSHPVPPAKKQETSSVLGDKLASEGRRKVWVSPSPETKGHTGYLLFARMWV